MHFIGSVRLYKGCGRNSTVTVFTLELNAITSNNKHYPSIKINMADGSKTINNIMQHSNKHRCTVKPCGILLGILGGGVLLCFPNPDPISDQKLLFSTPDFRPGLKAEIMSLLLRLQRKPKILPKYFEFAYFSVFLTHLELK